MAMQTVLSQPWTSREISPGASTTPDPIDDGVREICDRMADAWSRGDAAAMAAMLAPDCDHVTLARVRQVKRGRGALVDSWHQAFSRRGPCFSVRMAVATHTICMVRENLALVDGAFEYSEGIGAADIHQGRSSQAFTALMVRDVDWMVRALRVGPSTTAAKVVPCHDEVSS